MTATVVIAAPLFLIGATSEQSLGQEGASATVTASGPVRIETGAFYGDEFSSGTGDIRVQAEDMGGRVTPLPPHDRLSIDATIQTDDEPIAIAVRTPLVEDPMGEHTTWWGVGLGVEHHGNSGIGTSKLPSITSELAAFGLADVDVGGSTVATGQVAHVMTAESGLPGGARLELDVGSEGHPIPGVPAGHIRVLWQSYDARIEDPHPVQYVLGDVVLILFLAAALWLARGELSQS